MVMRAIFLHNFILSDNVPDILSDMKVCSICKLLQENFYKNKYRPDGLQSYCVACSKTRSQERYKNFSVEQKKEMRKLAQDKRIRNRQFLWDFLKRNPCIDCGEVNPVVLELDHIRDKSSNISNLVAQAVSIEKIQKELNKCEVRCANCHRCKTAKQFNWYKDIVL